MNKEERDREKEIRRLMYIKSELIRQTKKELVELRNELNSLGNNKGGKEYEEGPRLVKGKQRRNR